MVYRAGEMLLEQTQEILKGKINDVIVCRDLSNGGKLYYTVVIVHDRDIAKKIMKLFYGGNEKSSKFITDFTWKEDYFMVFEYVGERLLELFFSAEIKNSRDCEKLGLNLITECLACKIPYPILFLQLKQKQIHLSADQTIRLGYSVDLESFSEKTEEKDCVTLCARIIFDYLRSLKATKTTSYKLLEKKLWKGSCTSFSQLYKDLKMASRTERKNTFWGCVSQFFLKNQEKIFRWIMMICIGLGILTFLMFVTQFVFSDIPFIKFFINPFKQIGTESLLQ